METMNIKNVVRNEFDFIPLDVIIKLDGDYCINWLCEFSEYEMGDYYPMWGTVFSVRDNFLSEKIVENAQKIYEECNIWVGEQEDFGIILGINGAGYDFYEAHWEPLFNLLRNEI